MKNIDFCPVLEQLQPKIFTRCGIPMPCEKHTPVPARNPLADFDKEVKKLETKLNLPTDFQMSVPAGEETMTSSKKGVNIEPYLRSEMEKGSFDFRLVPRIGTDGRVYIYIHPFGRDGETMDYEASDDQLFLRY